ncbi:RNA-binding protein [Candidatus Roizmanbacteria bacterium RIFCSPLOWO2_01_FULL_37_12]|uniref:RNA-binding protein n=1 Tax=Candidatus Roizmanbacteria bacterium RIFCSPLOWO2_01_FULL_37_12 TaxID=1802056 RepID=A0A1F7IH01_9BACT|nr:MAG: RNA-binding protein [Candidatus Roizmanbacteria bacterium RIFCSPLOWO2_01_FULL_37_12]
MDKNKLFVGSLPWAVTSDGLKEMFAQFGEITEAVVITDRNTGRSKGFGFVTFAKEEDAQKALEMNGKEVEGRTIVVNTARPREDRRGGGGGGYRGGGGGGGNSFRRDRRF